MLWREKQPYTWIIIDMKKRKEALSAGDILEKALISTGHPNLVTFARIDRVWPEIVGEQLSKVSRPGDLSKRELTIWVKEPVWVDSLMYMKRKLIENINKRLSENMVGSIRVIRKKWEAEEPNIAEPLQPKAPLTKEAIKEVEKVVESIEDPELRSTLKRIMLKSLVAKLGKDGL